MRGIGGVGYFSELRAGLNRPQLVTLIAAD
jgi:hypothetical protein